MALDDALDGLELFEGFGLVWGQKADGDGGLFGVLAADVQHREVFVAQALFDGGDDLAAAFEAGGVGEGELEQGVCDQHASPQRQRKPRSSISRIKKSIHSFAPSPAMEMTS